MIRVVPKPMSSELRERFEVEVRGPGRKWLAENTLIEPKPGASLPRQKRLPDYWRRVYGDLADAFYERCAYTAMWLSHSGQIDHFISIEEDRSKAYDWENLRHCAGWFNSSKQNIRSWQILDPLEIEDDWFEITLPDLQLRVTEQCPEHLRERAEFMLDRLHLRNGSHVMRSRRAFYAQYRPEDPSTLARLENWAPLLARAIRKQIESSSEPNKGE